MIELPVLALLFGLVIGMGMSHFGPAPNSAIVVILATIAFNIFMLAIR